MSENKIENSYSSQMNDDLKKYMESINNIEPANDNYNLNSFEKEVNELDKKYSIDNYNVRKVQSDLIEEIISAITRYLDISKVIEDYVEAMNKEYAELQAIVEKEAKELDDVALSEEEIGKIRDDYLSKKITKSEAIGKLRKNIEEVRKQIQELREQIDQEKRELQFASIAGITREECQKLFSEESMREIIETVLSIKNTTDLAATRSTIAKMIAKAEKKNPLDNVQILSSNDEKVEQQEPSRPIKIAEDSLGNITINITITISREPVKVAGKAQTPENPGKAPADMINKNEENKAGNDIMAKEELEENWKFTKDGKDVTDEVKVQKSEEKPKKKKTSNDAFGVYKRYSNDFDKISDEIADIEKQLEASDEKDEQLLKLLEKKKAKKEELLAKMKAKLLEARELLEEEKATLSREEINRRHVGKDPLGKMKLINDALEPQHGTVEGDITTYALRGSNGLADAFTSASAKKDGQINGSSFRNMEPDPGLENTTGGSSGEGGDGDDTGTGDNGDVTIDDTPRLPSGEPRIAIPAYAESAHEHDGDEPGNNGDEPGNNEEVEDKPEERGFRDRVTIFRDLDNDKLYVRKAAFTRFFGLEQNIEQVRINGALCYEITEEEANYLESNQDNELSPYFIQYIEVQLGKRKTLTPIGGRPGGNGEGLNNDNPRLPSGEPRIAIPAYAESAHEHDGDEPGNNGDEPGNNEEVEDKHEERGLRDRITIFRDLDNDKLYVRKAAFTRFFGLEQNIEQVRINGALCYEITEEEANYLESNQDNELSPYFIQYIEVQLGKRKTLTPTGGRPGENGDEPLENEQRPGPNPPHPTGGNGNNGGNDGGDNGNNGNSGNGDEPLENEQRPGPNPPHPTGGNGNNGGNDGGDNGNNGNSGNGDEPLENEQRPGPNPPHPTGGNGNNGGNDDGDNGNNGNNGNGDEPLENEQRPGPNPPHPTGGTGNNGNGDEPLENEQRPGPNPPHPTGGNGNNGGNDDGDNGNNGNNGNGDEPLENEQRPGPNPPHPTGGTGNNGNGDEHGHDDGNDNQDEDDKDNDDERGLKDRVTIFRDLDNNGKLYIRKAAFTRFFGLEQNIEEVRIDGALCYAITEDEEKYLLDNQDNEISPYFVVYKDVHLGKKKPPVEEETVVIFKAVDDNDQLYATKEVHDKFGLATEGDPIEIQGKQCYKVSPEKNKIINDKAHQSENPKINVIYKPVYIKKKQEQPKVETHYQEVIRKLTKDLDIKAKDGKRYRASNIKVAQSFKDELKSGNYLYNILHFAPAVVKAGITFFRKLASKVLLTKRGRDVTKEINARLNGESENKEYNLTDEDLEVLWQHYKGRNLRADMNNQINPIILAKLREYGLRKVEALNNDIKQHYLAVIAATDEIEKLKEEIANTKNEKKKAELQNKLRELYKFAAESVRIIEDRRKQADDLLSNGVHGIEEDFKAVESKMNYIGLRFSKQNDFDNELQDRLADAGKRINTAKAYGDDKGLVEAFIDYEKIYYEETEVKNSIVGKRSTGNKWYQPIAEAMDYRDDPFIRDLFTTIATVSAAVSIANGLITHIQKDQQFQQQVNNDINSTNAANQQYHNSVQHEVQNIQAQRQAEIQGLQGQMNKDVRDAFNTGERGILDKSDWSFNGSYHADDAILHAQAQSLYESAQNQIQSVVSQLQSGAITETQAIEMLAKAEANLSTTVNNALQPLYNASKAYAQGHTFAYDATLVPSDWFANHPNAFVDFGNAIVAVNQSADALSLLSPSFMQTIGSLPSDLATTLAAGISSLALVKNVQTTMKNKTSGKNINHKNGELGEMFREHIIDRGEEEQRSHTK